MVAKVFLAAAAILICCGTTLQGECPDGKCDKSGKCSTASNAEKCSAETCGCEECSGEECTACKCQKSTSDDLKVAVVKDEECCEKKKCSTGECSVEKCTAATCQDAKCSAEKCSACKCDKSAASDELKVALVKDEECCEKKKCSACSAEKCSGSACKGSACSKTACTAGACNLSQCTAGSCGDGACSLTAGVGSMCETLKCAIVDAAKQEFTATCSGGTCSKNKSECSGKTCSKTACSGKSCGSECSTVVSAAEPCDTSFCFEGNCSAGECSAACSTEVCDGLKCAVEACLTLNGGEFTITTSKTWPGTPVEVAVAAEECTQVSTCTKSCGSECSAKCAGECSQECVAECSESTCGTLACSAEKCTADSCQSDSGVAVECTTQASSAATCTKVCKIEKCGTKQSELDAKLAALAELQREVEELRQSAGTPEQLTVNVKLVEVNISKCRKLGFSFDVTSPHMVTDLNETIEKSPDFLTSLQKNNLAKVIANPTIVCPSGRMAGFRTGGEFPVTDADGRTHFKEFGTKIDLLAKTIGNGKVQVDIRSEISKVTGNCGPAPCPALSANQWDSSLVAELGTPFVLSSACEQRVQAVRRTTPAVVGGEKETTTEVVEDIQVFAVVTVTAVESPAVETAKVHRAAFESEQQRVYEEELLADVVDEPIVVQVYPVADLQVWKVRPDGVEFDADLLVDYLKSSVDCDSWLADSQGEESAQIRPFERNGSLVIAQTKKNHDKIATLIQEMRIAGLKKTEAREQSEAGVVPASAVEPVSTEAKPAAKCSQGGCKAAKCPSGQCSKSPVSTTIDAAETAPECTGECPESGDCPCIGGNCTK
ncbi:hypothetical protein [Lacipirellula sp.]|uniref:hypothetical protein n=1 Tax=Lacipirellula sp. TaxID=2691419 RepID=UPI003D0A9392